MDGMSWSLPPGNAPAKRQGPSGVRRVIDNLETTNRSLVSRMAHDLLDLSHHPGQSLLTMARGMILPLVHPLQALRGLEQGIHDDALGGTLDAATTATGAACLGGLIVAGAGVLAAPFTAGASLAVTSAALGFAETAGTVAMAEEGGSILVHEARGATAPDEHTAEREGQTLAGYVEDETIGGMTWAAGDALEARLVPRTGETAARMLNNSLNLAGIYDATLGAVKSASRMTFHPRKGP